MKTSLIVALLILSSAGAARAGGNPGSVGLGAEFQLSGIGGLSANYDTGKFHVGGFVGLRDPDGPHNTIFDIGGRFFFHVASTAMTDFGVGGSLGIRNQQNADGTSSTLVFLEPSFQIRVFVAANVALSFTGGIEVGAGDISEVNITGNTVGEAGVHYYF